MVLITCGAERPRTERIAQGMLRVVIVVLGAVLVACAMPVGRKRVARDVQQLYPRARILDMGPGEGNDEAVDWHVVLVDSNDVERRLVIGYMHEDQGGWRIYYHKVVR